MAKTLEEFYKEYRSNFNPITNQQNLLGYITDQMIWDVAFTAGQEKIKRPDILVCDNCNVKGGHERCNMCNIGNLFALDLKEEIK
jgi:hypothetical protein